MYKNTQLYQAFNEDKIGILLTNLGTPDAPTKTALKRYLKQFLSDTRVIEPPPHRLIWQLILRLVVLNIRPKKSAQSYQTIWGKFGDGSPLLDISIKQKNALSQALKTKNIAIALGMRYGNPSIKSALNELEQQNCNKIIVLPLYPQYAAATTGATFDCVVDVLKTWRRVPTLNFINHYYTNPSYIKALALSVKEFWQQHKKPDLLLMSYHGIPHRYFVKGDPYPCHCCQTTYLLAKALDLKPNEYKMAYQSRFGTEQWIKDYTDEVLKGLPQKNIKNVQVICPGFSADCLETIEEIAEENKKYFLAAGGESYQYIPALNDSAAHINALVDIIDQEIV